MYDNIAEAAAILAGHDTGSGYFSLSVYPPSVPVNLELMENGVQQSLLASGALFKPCFCGPCFGAGDVPANNGLSIRHTTRNFPNREGSKPSDGQACRRHSHGRALHCRHSPKSRRSHLRQRTWTTRRLRRCSAALTARYTIAASTSASDMPGRIAPLKYGPNIAEWPAIPALADDLLMQVASVLRDEVTTTDELIPSGETSSYRSNPLKLAEFALSRRDPDYVPRAKALRLWRPPAPPVRCPRRLPRC